jgi:hypothetical protein
MASELILESFYDPHKCLLHRPCIAPSHRVSQSGLGRKAFQISAEMTLQKTSECTLKYFSLNPFEI